MRLKYSLRNIIAVIFRQILTLGLNFVARTIFINVLGYDYLGLNGLFSDILSMLSVAELGIGTSITFAMYRPMAEHDEEKLYSLVMVYRKTYLVIGIAVAVIGTALTPFLPYLIKDSSGISDLSMIYLLVLTNSVVTYFFSYKITLLNVAQESYKESLVRSVTQAVLVFLQIVFLLATHNYMVYLVLQLIMTVVTHAILSRIADREFVFLHRRDKAAALEPSEKEALIKNVRALILHKMGNFFVNGTDNLIISKLLGLVVNGVYANYLLITKTIRGFTYLIFSALTASVGNLNATENADEVIDRFGKIYLMGYWVTVFCSVSLLCLLNPFIEMLWGASFELPVVIIIVLNFYLGEMRNPVITFKDAMGLYWQDRYKPLLESVINITTSILLGNIWGIFGVLVGTLLSAVGAACWMEPLVLYRHGFHRSAKPFFVQYIKKTILAVLIGGVTYQVTSRIAFYGWGGLLVKAAICVILPNGILLILYSKSKEFQYYLALVRKALCRIRR